MSSAGKVEYSKAFLGRVQADGPLTLTRVEVDDIKLAVRHSITITRKTATAGTFAVKVKPAQCDTWQALTKNGSALSVDLAATAEPQVFGFEMPIDEWQITPTGANGTFDVAVAGW
jgi:hypothetical protein